MFTTLTTPRLTLRRFRLVDLPALRAYRTDPDVARFQSWGDQDDADSIAAIHRALESGINWIDTAAIYGPGHSEEVVARARAGPRGLLIGRKFCADC